MTGSDIYGTHVAVAASFVFSNTGSQNVSWLPSLTLTITAERIASSESRQEFKDGVTCAGHTNRSEQYFAVVMHGITTSNLTLCRRYSGAEK
jgi:hypothetical protein